ncbi:MAG: hypothetical protein A2675_03810 [Candidatus Yonathbacteria bacterium RIFCSPHIGHO2_01_FULL_51_10]|uniref:RecF/RecN/SMC N-terminal domain-containing protein n=1 Tax=Candidatus Yonathbacteria bacterium RIFCSPHIGHO2_01_FULL_51_10 TaxID=1802723 RepID=A0A1G2S689_9BACT|nr:MAG: hypothetical protein A2675_03810 [Candidatus Yonathbacteria bacterium RIFCSPHIGHO2_01_FULL_51_10]
MNTAGFRGFCYYMRLKRLEISGFKSFAKKTELFFDAPITAVVGPNGSGKSNVVEAMRFVLGEQSLKSMRGKRGEDLIFNGSRTAPRQNRASVSIVFDNTNRTLNLDFDEVVLSREVHRDGVGEYFINGSAVRLKDIIELLSSVHIGASGHHIISQGEADRILNASIKERRAMIEDALGLKIYQWKISESERKLEKTDENIAQVDALRKEIAPHIKFLKKQVEKVEQARALRDELAELYREYLKREDTYLATESNSVAQDKSGPSARLAELGRAHAEAESAMGKQDGNDPEQMAKLHALEQALGDARRIKDELARSLGRVEGGIEYEERRLAEEEARAGKEGRMVPAKEIEAALAGPLSELESAEQVGDLDGIRRAVRSALQTIRQFTQGLFSGSRPDAGAVEEAKGRINALKQERETLSGKAEEAASHEREAAAQLEVFKKTIENEKNRSRDAERSIYQIRAERSELLSKLESVRLREERLDVDMRHFEEEIREGIALVGMPIREYEQFTLPADAMHEPRDMQEGRRRKIERIKIRLEDMGAGGSEEVMKEYDDAVSRDAFLERELLDLRQSATSLRDLIRELSEKLDQEFKIGITKINKQFQEFFILMFGGGAASLQVVIPQRKRKESDDLTGLDEDAVPPEEEDEEAGIDINVSLPHKKIRGLEVLSGGERALTSIALLFAVSQVNPPPFLVLDETDAALDEANSRKYGDMLDNLSRYSQLIVVTHNRETMSRAGILYGVTMSSDAVSKLLSIKFDEAAAIAK